MRVWKGWYLYVSRQKVDRYWGFLETYYDGPIYSFGFWWFHVYLIWPYRWPVEKK